MLWGWHAKHQATVKQHEKWQYQYRFKLRLAHENFDADLTQEDIPPLPPGKTTVDVIADFLRLMSVFILTTVQEKAAQAITKRDIKWCLTVPAQWTPKARAAMHRAAVLAGIVKVGEYPRNPVVVLTFTH